MKRVSFPNELQTADMKLKIMNPNIYNVTQKKRISNQYYRFCLHNK